MMEATGSKDIIIYETSGSEVRVEILLKDKDLWLTQAQISELFEVKKAAVSKHLKNIFLDGELESTSVVSILETTASDGKRYKTNFYNLDAIIAVGYRVNSRKATKFRIWATNTLHNYIVDGYAVNENQIKQERNKLAALQTLANSLAENIKTNKLNTLNDIKKAALFLQDFANGLTLLDDFDRGTLDTKGETVRPAVKLSEEDFFQIIEEMKIRFESDIFAVPKDSGFSGAVANIYQTFGGKELYPSLEEKAAMLLYSLIKDHCFADGNKRIAAACFLYFMEQNDMLYVNGKKRIDEDTLFALTVFIAESKVSDMEIFRQIIISILNRNLGCK